MNFKENDKVVTTQGIYGICVSIDEKANTSKILIGKKIRIIDNNKIFKCIDDNYVICYCTDGYKEFNMRIAIPKHFEIYNSSNPLNNPLLEYCTNVIKESVNSYFTILKIKF